MKSESSPVPSCVSMKSESSPVPSCVSMKSESSPLPSCVSMKSESSPLPSCVSMKSESSPVPSCVSMKSESSPVPSCVSMKSESSPLPSCVSMKSESSPVPSCVSMKSESSPLPSCVSMKSESSPVPSCVSMKSESSPLPSCVSMKSESSPVPSCVSMKSESSPVPSCVSMKSDRSMGYTPNFCSRPVTSDLHAQKKTVKISKDKLESVFKELEHKIISLLKNELKRFKNLFSPDYPACTERQVEDEEDQSSVREGALKITLHVLRNMNHTDLANTLQTKLAPACHRKLKSKLREKCQKINEGISQHGTTALLNEIYTELYITEGGSGEVNNEHEVRQIETVSRRPATQETPIKCSDIFRPLPGQDKAIRTVLTKGVAGIGKTVSVQKFILDWSEGNVNQDVLFIFPLPFREFNLMKEKKLSLVQLLYCFFPEIHELKPTDYTYNKFLFIFDGLDECRLPLDFQNNDGLWDVTESTSVDVLLTNLIKGNLLSSALLWITSRPAATNQIPPECVDQVTEVRGFSAPQKEEYFRKRIRHQSLANRIISHMKSSRSLYIMCHIPVFCWIAATGLERMLGEAESGEIPKTLTQMFTHFLIFNIKHKHRKYDQKSYTYPHQTRKHVLALGKLAFQQLEKGNLIFYEDELRNSGIDVREMSVYSGMCTQIFREEFGLQLGKVFSFVHLSIQEFLAALYVFITFISTNTNVLQQQQPGFFSIFKKSISSLDFLNSAVDKALESQNGHLDLFLRFLLGLSLKSNQTLLQGLLTMTGSSSHSNEKTIKYIKEKIRENPSPEKSINLFHCLNELNDQSLVQEVQTYLSRRGDTRLRGARLSPAQWSAVAFVLLNSEEELDEFDLRKYHPSEECLLKLLPVVKASRKAILSGCGLTEESCKSLTSVLQTENSSMRELEINNNDLQDSGVEQLCAGLKSSNCKLEILRLSGCLVTEEGCSSLASALSSNPSHLKELDLTYNHPGDSGVKLLSARLEDPHCRLDTLRCV
ncbi:NLR family CARD domain-containing protein 3-like isoform X3 [Brachyhypopomus gauderio]|uniref:NLR family CARD domain-containing protein 3-like isoform X3 n=1 Tax=Brachyhypopomus gauderio TaxID=698409 RepID=UPI0040413012